MRNSTLLTALALLGACTPGSITTDDELGESESGESESESSTDSSTSESSETGESSESTETEAEATDGSCPPSHVECPDGTCQLAIDEYSCCGHGGECARGCEPQDAMPGEGPCSEPTYAWNGTGCDELCPCVGSDCDATWPTSKQCLQAHAACGIADFADCPFDETVAEIILAGTTPEGPLSFTAGSFGFFTGKGGGPMALVTIRLAPSQLALGNHLANQWMMTHDQGILVIETAPNQPGVHDVMVHFADDYAWIDAASGTLTIESIDMEPDLQNFANNTLIASLEIDEGQWQLSGSFGIRGCALLYFPAP